MPTSGVHTSTISNQLQMLSALSATRDRIAAV
jgi:hypothetical protein